ncbi:MAG: HYC_CC_PP family protein [bacterium]
MKKLLAIILLLVHTAASSGTVLSAHYCMGDFAGIKVGHTDEKADHCPSCGMKDMGCCHEEPQLIKLDNTDIQKTAVVFPDFKLSLSLVQHQPDAYTDLLTRTCSHNFSSLDIGRPPTYKLICVYRI